MIGRLLARIPLTWWMLVAALVGCAATLSSCAVFGPMVGELELMGIRFPVTAYQAEVIPGKLWRGSRIDELHGYLMLRTKGIGTIFDLRAEGVGDGNYGAAQAGLQVVREFVVDNTVPTMAQVNDALEQLQETWARGEAAYFHCQAGVGRTGVFVAAVRVKLQGWTPEAALEEAKRYGMVMPSQMSFILGLHPRG